LLDQDPEKVKELTNIKEIEDLVDEYMQNEYEGVISGDIKTKFRVIIIVYSIFKSNHNPMVSVMSKYSTETIKS